jgi:hypothetical protein
MFYLLYGSTVNLIFFNIGQDSITVVENRSKEYEGADLQQFIVSHVFDNFS